MNIYIAIRMWMTTAPFCLAFLSIVGFGNCSIAPIIFGLTMAIHDDTGSKSIIDCLNKKGFCLSYHEAIQFHNCAATGEINTLPNNINTDFCHFMADNIDHNITTIRPAVCGRG